MSTTPEEIHIGDIGTVIQLTIYDGDSVVDISGASVKNIVMVQSDGTKATKTAVFTTDGTDGKIEYTTIASDLAVAGKLLLQGIITYANDDTWKTNVITEVIHANI